MKNNVIKTGNNDQCKINIEDLKSNNKHQISKIRIRKRALSER